MRWENVRKDYPDQWVKLKILDSYITGKKKIIKDMEVIKTIKDEKLVSKELGKCNKDELVYHTSNSEIFLEIKDVFGFRMVN